MANKFSIRTAPKQAINDLPGAVLPRAPAATPTGQVEPPGTEPADHARGRPRGGWTTRVRLACEQGSKPLSTVTTAGHRGDRPQFMPVLQHIRVRAGPDRVGPGPARIGCWPTGVLVPGQPCLPAPSRCPGDHPDQARSAGQPTQPWITRWTATTVRRRDLPPAARRRMQHQPAQTAPEFRHPLRQSCPTLRSHHHIAGINI